MPRITELKRLIVGKNIIQADLAEAVGISEYRLSRIVNGRIKPTEYERKHLANFFGIERKELPV